MPRTRPTPNAIPFRSGHCLSAAGPRTWRLTGPDDASSESEPAPLRPIPGLDYAAFAADVRAAAGYALPWQITDQGTAVADSLDLTAPVAGTVRRLRTEDSDAGPSVYATLIRQRLIDTMVANHNALIAAPYGTMTYLGRVLDVFAEVERGTVILRDMRDQHIVPTETQPILFRITAAPGDGWAPPFEDSFAWYLAGLINVPPATAYDFLESQRYLSRMHARLDALPEIRAEIAA